MEKISFGETAVLENNEEYICLATFKKDGEDYAFFADSNEPPAVKIAKQDVVNGELFLAIITDDEEKKEILEFYKERYIGTASPIVE